MGKDINNILYDEGFDNGVVTGRRVSYEEYRDKLEDIVRKESAGIELTGLYELEKIEASYEAWHKIYHYIYAVKELLENDTVKSITMRLFGEIFDEIQSEYMVISDDYHEIVEEKERLIKKCKKEVK